MEKKKNKLVTLKKNKEFTFVYHRGKSCATRRMVLVYFKNKYGGLRSGFSVSKKVGGAVVRNKVRRRMKECMREILKTHPDTAWSLWRAKHLATPPMRSCRGTCAIF